MVYHRAFDHTPLTRADVSFQNWPNSFAFHPPFESAHGAHGAVATTDAFATDAGVEVLREGGNAVDATVAVALALAVVNPEAGNLGGGGFMLVRTAAGEVVALDHRSTAPAGARPDMFWDGAGGTTAASVLGHRAVAVPGSVRGLWDAHRRLGCLPWPRLVEPAITLAVGFEIRPRFLDSLPPHIVEGLSRFESSAAVFLPHGRPPTPGSVLRQPDLAETLMRIRDEGADGFYRGETADRIVAEMARAGGLITHDDLAGVRSAWRAPVHFDYRGHTVWSMPPSSSGGVTLALSAHALARFRLGELDWHGADHLHLLVEAWRRAFADRNHWLGDPEATPMPLDALLAPGYGAARGADIDLSRATRSDLVGPGHIAGAAAPPPPREGLHTTHVSIVDGAGNAVAFTTTLNTWYGSKLVAAGTGVLLNNEMDDFTARPGVPNFFGLIQGEANAIGPGKRMLSAMTPTLVTGPTGDLRFVVGSPGGATIITTVFQLLSNLLDFGWSLPDAVGAPRVHHQHRPDHITVEPGALPQAVSEALEERGHEVVVGPEPWGDVEAVAVGSDGVMEVVADPRRGGVARAF